LDTGVQRERIRVVAIGDGDAAAGLVDLGVGAGVVRVTDLRGAAVVVAAVGVGVTAWDREVGVRSVPAEISEALVPGTRVAVLTVTVGQTAARVLGVLTAAAHASVCGATVSVQTIRILEAATVDGWMGAAVVDADVVGARHTVVVTGIITRGITVIWWHNVLTLVLLAVVNGLGELVVTIGGGLATVCELREGVHALLVARVALVYGAGVAVVTIGVCVAAVRVIARSVATDVLYAGVDVAGICVDTIYVGVTAERVGRRDARTCVGDQVAGVDRARVGVRAVRVGLAAVAQRSID
jgi:hypothetical protein